MIYTIPPNPALDRTLWVERVVADDRIEREHRCAVGIEVAVPREHWQSESTQIMLLGLL